MRVLVYGLSSDKLGGIETFLLNMNRFMSDNMIFDYIVEGTRTIHQAAIEEKGGDVYFISLKRNMLQNIRDWKRILKEYRKTSQVIYFNMFSLAWVVPIYIAKKYGYRVIVHAHNNNLHNCGLVLKSMHAVNRFLLQYSSIVRFTNSDLSSKFFFGKKKAEMIYNAIDTERFAFRPDVREKMRRELEIQDKHVYGFSGRIAYQKNPLFLMEIFAGIAKIDHQSAFLVCGDGDLMEQTKQKAQELGIRVQFLGNVLNVQDYYQAMDCFILPSRFEGLGIVLIEAQCSGLNCIASKDVIPVTARVTELLEFVDLEKVAKVWAELSVRRTMRTVNRRKYKNKIECTNFNIRHEAIRLSEQIFGGGDKLILFRDLLPPPVTALEVTV